MTPSKQQSPWSVVSHFPQACYLLKHSAHTSPGVPCTVSSGPELSGPQIHSALIFTAIAINYGQLKKPGAHGQKLRTA